MFETLKYLIRPALSARSIQIKPSCLTKKANVTAFKAHRNYSYFTWAPLSAEANLVMVQCTLFSESFRMLCVFYLGLSPVMRSGGRVPIKRVLLSQLDVRRIGDMYGCSCHDVSVLLACFGAGSSRDMYSKCRRLVFLYMLLCLLLVELGTAITFTPYSLLLKFQQIKLRWLGYWWRAQDFFSFRVVILFTCMNFDILHQDVSHCVFLIPFRSWNRQELFFFTLFLVWVFLF